MAISRKHIGRASEPATIDVDKGMLKFFAKTTGETDPIYFQEEAARLAGHPSLPAPPTYCTVLAAGLPAEQSNMFADLEIDIRRILHGEQSYQYHRMIYAGDSITLQTTISDIYSKKGGALEFVVSETSAVNQDRELCVEMRSVLVVRNEN